MLTAMARGIDGMVGRMVDRLGGSPRSRAAAEEPGGERVWLLAYSVVSVRRDDPRLIRRGEVIEFEPFEEERLVERLVREALREDQSLSEADERFLRVHLELLDSWRRPCVDEGPAPAEGAASGQGTDPPLEPRAEELLAALRELGGEASTRRLVEQTLWPRGRVRYWLQQLIASGKAIRVGEGSATLYRAVEGPASPPGCDPGGGQP